MNRPTLSISELITYTHQELIEQIQNEAEAYQESLEHGAEFGPDDTHLANIEQIIYTIRNCTFKGHDDEEAA